MTSYRRLDFFVSYHVSSTYFVFSNSFERKEFCGIVSMRKGYCRAASGCVGFDEIADIVVMIVTGSGSGPRLLWAVGSGLFVRAGA